MIELQYEQTGTVARRVASGCGGDVARGTLAL
jgi:hypothetical protein